MELKMCDTLYLELNNGSEYMRYNDHGVYIGTY